MSFNLHLLCCRHERWDRWRITLWRRVKLFGMFVKWRNKREWQQQQQWLQWQWRERGVCDTSCRKWGVGAAAACVGQVPRLPVVSCARESSLLVACHRGSNFQHIVYFPICNKQANRHSTVGDIQNRTYFMFYKMTITIYLDILKFLTEINYVKGNSFLTCKGG